MAPNLFSTDCAFNFFDSTRETAVQTPANITSKRTAPTALIFFLETDKTNITLHPHNNMRVKWV
jgi:hypothetical protein